MANNMQIHQDNIVGDKIYLTRTHLKRKKEIGEKRFEQFFRDNGFSIIAPEELSLKHQACIFHNAKVVASLEGTHAHGIVWSRGTIKQIILRKQSEVIPRQMMLNQLWGIKTLFIDVFEEPYKGFPITHDRGPFLLKWTEQMERFASDNGMNVISKYRKGFIIDFFEYSVKCGFYWVIHRIKGLVR